MLKLDTQNGNHQRSILLCNVRFYLLAILITITTLGHAQHTLKGIVQDVKDEPVGFCHVVNKTFGIGKVSDRLGKFEISARKGDTLHFSYVGYKSLELIIESVHLVNFMKITLPEDSLMLPSITIYADPYYKVPINLKGEPIVMSGITVEDMTQEIKPGSVRPGAPGMAGVLSPGVTLYGPITYFSRDEREKRAAEEAYVETRETITYQKFVAQDSVRTKLCSIYKINNDQYDELIVMLNSEFPGIQKEFNPKDIWNWLLVHFNRSVHLYSR